MSSLRASIPARCDQAMMIGISIATIGVLLSTEESSAHGIVILTSVMKSGERVPMMPTMALSRPPVCSIPASTQYRKKTVRTPVLENPAENWRRGRVLREKKVKIFPSVFEAACAPPPFPSLSLSLGTLSLFSLSYLLDVDDPGSDEDRRHRGENQVGPDEVEDHDADSDEQDRDDDATLPAEVVGDGGGLGGGAAGAGGVGGLGRVGSGLEEEARHVGGVHLLCVCVCDLFLSAILRGNKEGRERSEVERVEFSWAASSATRTFPTRMRYRCGRRESPPDQTTPHLKEA